MSVSWQGGLVGVGGGGFLATDTRGCCPQWAIESVTQNHLGLPGPSLQLPSSAAFTFVRLSDLWLLFHLFHSHVTLLCYCFVPSAAYLRSGLLLLPACAFCRRTTKKAPLLKITQWIPIVCGLSHVP